MLFVNLRPIFAARGIEKPFSFLVKSGFTHNIASSLLNGATRNFRLNHIEKLCEVLFCEPNDLLLWKPETDKVIAANHPLNKFRQSENDDIDLKKALSNLPYQQLKEISRKLTGVINDKQ